ncbi:cytidine deaminase [Motiliproteus sp. MSK22-1]|uniref:cytidine deaminase n=1 Tax=Motiliproteus sp. MSK22-1 TaxID=1897630 RepID=UPI00097603F4|nr:cytidine deaminase [Motiliproteus sp. MSK22-1]
MNQNQKDNSNNNQKGNASHTFTLAQQAMAKAYAPYSGFKVGAVIEGSNGKFYSGCNVENAAYPQGCCAEASAISAMVIDGETSISAITVIGAGDSLITPCGGCRQRIREFAKDQTPIHLCSSTGVEKTLTLGDLLPLSFGPEHIDTENQS